MEINERFIKLTGSFPTNKELVMDQILEIKAVVDVVKVEDKSNQDGTQDRVYTCKVSEIFFVENE